PPSRYLMSSLMRQVIDRGFFFSAAGHHRDLHSFPTRRSSDLVLIESLDLSIGPGLTALTGETGAGKSIILDALGLATGARADAGLVRRGAAQAMVSAVFAPTPGHPVWDLREEKGLS